MIANILTLAGKDLLLLWRDRIGFFWWIVGFPLLVAIMIGAAFAGTVGGETEPLAIGVVDNCGSAQSAAFRGYLERQAHLSVRLLDEPAAERAVRQGELAAYVVLGKDFSLGPALLESSRLPLELRVDPAARLEAAYLEAVIKEALFVLVRSGLTGGPADAGPELSVVPVGNAAVRPRSSFELCFPLGMIWGLLGLTAEFAQALARERNVGTALRVRVAPLARGELLAGSGLACFSMALAVLLLLLVLGRCFFGVRWQNPAILLPGALCVAFGCAGLSLFFSVCARTEMAVQGVTWAALLVLTLFGGGMVPEVFLPGWMVRVGEFSPIGWALTVIEGGVWREVGWSAVWLPAAKLVGLGLACFPAGHLVLRLRGE